MSMGEQLRRMAEIPADDPRPFPQDVDRWMEISRVSAADSSVYHG